MTEFEPGLEDTSRSRRHNGRRYVQAGLGGAVVLTLLAGVAGAEEWTSFQPLNTLSRRVPGFKQLAANHDEQIAGKKRVKFAKDGKQIEPPVERAQSQPPVTDKSYRDKVVRAGAKDANCDSGERIRQVNTRKKMVALLITDGPSGSTRDILSSLKQADAHASFFLDANKFDNEDGRKRVREIVDAGQDIGSQGYSHAADGNVNAAEQPQANQAFEKAVDAVPLYYRVPGGGNSRQLQQVVAESDQCFIAATPGTDQGDWKQYKKEPEAARRGLAEGDAEIIDNLEPGQIIPVREQPAALADNPGHAGLDSAHITELINGIQDADFELVTVTELLKQKR